MSTNSTTSNYISKINQEFPVAGQNNDSSGFRNNFKNIKSALSSADQDINDLKLNSVKLIGTNDFNNSIIKRVVLQNSSTMVYDDTGNTQTGDVQLDYTNGSYQKIRLGGGTHMITVSNWPVGTRSGSIVLSVITSSVAGSYVNFNAVNLVSLGPDPLPVMLAGNTEQFFELWCDGDTNNLFVRGLGGGARSALSTTINISTATTLTINTNVFATSKNPDTRYATTVTANGKSGNLALVPNQIKVKISNAPVPDVLGDTVATTFPVTAESAVAMAGVMLGASINFPESTNPATFIVTNFTTSTITVTPAFEVTAFHAGDDVIITNPRFTEQPTVVTVGPTAISTSSSVIGDLKGQISASSTSLYVTYADHSYGTTNKVKFSGDNVTMVTQPTTTKSTALATTEFVHNIMPYGAIIMWHGLVSAVPTGWALCDGTNSTPDLTGKFIVGASIDALNGSNVFYAATEVTGGFTQTGGSKDATVVQHNHTASATSRVTDPGHNHTIPFSANGVGGGTGPFMEGGRSATVISSTTTNITVSTAVAIDSAGIPGDNKNLPPYYALCYIMKTTGA